MADDISFIVMSYKLYEVFLTSNDYTSLRFVLRASLHQPFHFSTVAYSLYTLFVDSVRY